MRHYQGLSRAEIRCTFKAFCDARPAGAKFAHRACDRPAGSSPSMKWVNPPVAYMLHAGVPLLVDAGVHLPGLHDGDRSRVALEGYPGLLARELIGTRSYKADDAARQDRRAADRAQGHRRRAGAGSHAARAAAEAVAGAARAAGRGRQGDSLDAVLCLMQAAWASRAAGLRAAGGHRPAGGLDRHGLRNLSRTCRAAPLAGARAAAP